MRLQTNSRLAAHYHLMRRIRTFEERVGELFVRGQSAGSMLHLSIGEEAAAVGVGSNMTTYQWLFLVMVRPVREFCMRA